MKIRDYLNVYFALSIISLIVGILCYLIGYGYVTGPGLFVIKNRRAVLILMIFLAVVFLVMNIIYVYLKRKHIETRVTEQKGTEQNE